MQETFLWPTVGAWVVFAIFTVGIATLVLLLLPFLPASWAIRKRPIVWAVGSFSMVIGGSVLTIWSALSERPLFEMLAQWWRSDNRMIPPTLAPAHFFVASLVLIGFGILVYVVWTVRKPGTGSDDGGGVTAATQTDSPKPPPSTGGDADDSVFAELVDSQMTTRRTKARGYRTVFKGKGSKIDDEDGDFSSGDQ